MRQNDLAAGGKIRGQEGGHNIMVGVLNQRRCGAADLSQIKGADIAGHTDGDTHIGIDQNIGESRREEGRFLHLPVITIDKIDGILIHIGEQFGAERIEFALGITGGGIGHIPRIVLTEVTLRLDKGIEQSLVATGQTHQGIVNGLVAVGIEFHGLAHYVGRLG